jgi:hypothetical protein
MDMYFLILFLNFPCPFHIQHTTSLGLEIKKFNPSPPYFPFSYWTHTLCDQPIEVAPSKKEPQEIRFELDPKSTQSQWVLPK